jgi:hypothetical protein
MTESEWLASTDPQAMLAFLRDSGKLSERQARLFAVACCRRIWHLLEDERSRRGVEVLESYAEGAAGTEELAVAALRAREVEGEYEAIDNLYAAGAAANAVNADPDTGEEGPNDSTSNAMDAAFAASWAVGHALHPEEANDAWLAITKAEQAEQCRLLRCIIGNPFRAMPTVPAAALARNESCVVKLAASIYQDRNFSQQRMGVLADALEEAGVTGEEVLAHLRSPGPHCRGCWAVDLVLGKE